MKTVVAFDFDGTLTRRDTLFLFLRHVAGSSLRYYCKMFLALPVMMAYALRLLSNHEAKRHLISRFLKGMHRSELEKSCDAFADVIDKNLRQEAMSVLNRHKEHGDELIIVSASLRCWIEPWAKRNGFAHVIATELKYSEQDVVAGEFSTPNCHGEEKVRRLREYLTPRDQYRLIAYGDSRADLPMLHFSDESHYRDL